MLVACPGAVVRGDGGVWVELPGAGLMGKLLGGQWVVPWGGMLRFGMGEAGMVELGAVEFGMALGLVGGVGAAVAVIAATPNSSPDRVVQRYFMISSPWLRQMRSGVIKLSGLHRGNPCAMPQFAARDLRGHGKPERIFRGMSLSAGGAAAEWLKSHGGIHR
jgi:hypothetical protein